VKRKYMNQIKKPKTEESVDEMLFCRQKDKSFIEVKYKISIGET